MNILAPLYFLIIFGLLSQGLALRIQERERSIVPDRVQNGIIQIALAQHRHISDPASPFPGSYAADLPALRASGYLPVWEDDPGFRIPPITPPGFTIEYTAEDAGEAGRIAARMGNIATVTGNVIVVGFADPTDLALLDSFVELAGDTMLGDLDMGGFTLTNASALGTQTLTVQNGGAGRIDADIIFGTTATFNDIHINP